MIERFANIQAVATTQRDRIVTAQREAQARATAAPVFADLRRFAEPSTTRMVWMPRADGLHPSLV